MLNELFINIVASLILLTFGFFYGKYRERKLFEGNNLEDYDFYPFKLDNDDNLIFDIDKFFIGVDFLIKNYDKFAGYQLILIGQQNNISDVVTGKRKKEYKKLYRKYDGIKLVNDTDKFLKNYKRIVRLIGDSFPDSGIEILLHNLTNPSKALYHIKNNVTGRDIESPATNLVHDLKMRGLQNKDKLNYELNIGYRKFKCTTIPIYRENFGLIGAICINVDYNYINDEVRSSNEKLDKFINSILKTDMVLDENILSKNEYDKAINGKKHFRDFD